MAEIFGVITGAISVGSLVIQIFDTVQELKSFIGSVRDAPKDIIAVLDELDLLANVLISLQSELKKEDLISTSKQGSNDRVMQQSIEYCVRVARDLEDMVVELGTGMGGSKMRRRWTLIKAAMGKDKITAHLGKLERAKSMLSLTVECFTLKLQLDLRSSTTLLMSSIAPATSLVTQELAQKNTSGSTSTACPVDTHQKGMQYSSSERVIRTLWLGFGIYIYKHEARKNRRVEDTTNVQEDEVYQIERSFLPSVRFSQKGFSLISRRLHGDWQYTFTPVRIVPDSHPIWDACASGNVKVVRESLENGVATFYDTSSEGYTMLSVAAANCRPNLCEWLIEQGSRTDRVATKLGKTTLYEAGTLCDLSRGWEQRRKGPQRISHGTKDRPTDIYNTVRILVEKGNCDPMARIASGRSLIHSYNGPPETYRYLLQQQQQFMIDFTSEDKHGLRAVDWMASSIGEYGFENMKVMLSQYPDITSLVNKSLKLGGAFMRMIDQQTQPESGFNLLHATVFRLSALSYQKNHSLDKGAELLIYLLKLGFDVHGRTRFGATPLDYLIDYTHDEISVWIPSKSTYENVTSADPELVCERDKTEIILLWFQVLRTCGFNLKEYAMGEEALREGCVKPIDYRRIGVERKVYFEFLDADDIVLKVKDVKIEVEGEKKVPGNWVEEDEYTDDDGLIVMHNVKPTADWIVDSRELGTIGIGLSQEKRPEKVPWIVDSRELGTSGIGLSQEKRPEKVP